MEASRATEKGITDSPSISSITSDSSSKSISDSSSEAKSEPSRKKLRIKFKTRSSSEEEILKEKDMFCKFCKQVQAEPVFPK